MQRKLQYLFSFIIVFALTFSLFSPLAEASSLQRYVEKNVGTGSTSVTVQHVKTKKVILDYKGNISRQPASNLKIITGFAALNLLGEDFRFKTEIYTDGHIENGILKGNLFIKGHGDPTLQYSNLVTIANVLKKQGIKQIEGHIVADDTYFSGPALSPGVIKSEESNFYAAPSSALTIAPNSDYDAGTVIVQVTPTKVGSKGTVKILPGNANLKVINKSVTSKKGSSNTIKVKRTSGTNNIVISGNIPVSQTAKEWVTVLNPTMTTLNYVRSALTGAGIKINSKSQLLRQAVKSQQTLLYTYQSPPLKSMYPVFMKLSNNTMADSFIKTIGAELAGTGTLDAGYKEIKKYLQQEGYRFSLLKMVDGSGLSKHNRVTTNDLANLLNSIQQQPTFGTFYKGLPIGGNSNRLIGGTLKSRFTGKYANLVVAKTGYIHGVYSLSGYVKTRKGNQYVVSIISNGNKSSKIGQIDQFVKYLIDNH